MFQNIQKNIQEENYEQLENKRSIKDILIGLFNLHNIAIYVISFMISMVGFKSENFMLSISPFAISFLAAALSNRMSIGISYLFTLLGTFISFGTSNLLTYFLTTLVFFILVLIKRPKEQEGMNEEKRVGIHLAIAVLAVQIIPMFFTNFYVYDLLTSFMLAICSFIFYKIFANSILIIREFGKKKVFSIEEVMGTSLLLAISLCALSNITVFGYSLQNILSILLVLILGWKNGMLVRSYRRNYNRNSPWNYRK